MQKKFISKLKNIQKCLEKRKQIMKKNANEIFMLQYRIKRYQAMGNGTMCQALNGKLQKLLAKQANITM